MAYKALHILPSPPISSLVPSSRTLIVDAAPIHWLLCCSPEHTSYIPNFGNLLWFFPLPGVFSLYMFVC